MAPFIPLCPKKIDSEEEKGILFFLENHIFIAKIFAGGGEARALSFEERVFREVLCNSADEVEVYIELPQTHTLH